MSDHKTSPECSLVIASVVALEGALIVPISLNVIPVNPATFHAPRLVVATAGMAFLLLAFMIAFVLIYLWVGLGPGKRRFGPATNTGTANELEGRLFAAAFGVLAALGTVYNAILRACRLPGREDTRKPAPAELPDSGSDRNWQA